MGDTLIPRDVVVSGHAVRRLRLRFGLTRSWSWQRCERWMVQAILTAVVIIHRRNGECYARAEINGRTIYIVAIPSADGSACLVRTVLPHAFAENNLNHRHLR